MIGLSAQGWSAVGSCATAVGSAIAVGALIAAWCGLKHNARSLELQILDGIFHDIRELDRQYIADFELMNMSQRTAWSATFFNTVEYLCFLIANKLAPNDVLRKFFFDQALPAWRALFDEHIKKGILKRDGDSFEEFRKASDRFGQGH